MSDHYSPESKEANSTARSVRLFGGKSRILAVIIFFLVLTALGAWGLWYIHTPPQDFPTGTPVEVRQGDTLDKIAKRLQQYGVIRSPFWFRLWVILEDGERAINAGSYSFTAPQNARMIAETLVRENPRLDLERITLLEGWDKFRIAEELEERFPLINAFDIYKLGKEGRLFPDTYYFRSDVTAEEVVQVMTKNFEEQTAPLKEQAQETGREFEQILIMASLLETEANTKESKRKIADILWRRKEAGMPLQVDAAFSYVNGKNSYQLTIEDLRTDHPYNTYTRTGLPPGPIANPGLRSLRAALNPLENDYWYFLSDLSGNMYYARDFEEHQYNRLHYLRHP